MQISINSLSLVNFKTANAPILVTRLVTRVFGPGHSTGGTASTSTGVTITYTNNTLVNESGAAMTNAQIALIGWMHTTGAPNLPGNDVPVTAVIQYPVGTTVGTFTSSGGGTITVPNGGQIASDLITLSASIPAGATFGVTVQSNLTSGLKYPQNLGFVGVMSQAMSNTIRNKALFVMGDSIMTNNSSALSTAATGRVPLMQMSISGTTAQTYATGTNFDRYVALASLLGCTWFVSNYGTNDLQASRTAAQVLADLQTLRAKMSAVSIPMAQCTMLPRVTSVTVTPSSVTSSGTAMSVVVPDATQFVVGRAYTLAGATQTEYNQDLVCEAINTGTNTLTFIFPGSGTPTATGTITLKSYTGYSSRELQTPNAAFGAGPSSPRGTLNAAIRSGSFDSVLEWGDAFELTRDDGLFVVGGDKSALLASDLTQYNVSTIINTTRFTSTFAIAGSSLAPGFVQFKSGGNPGVSRSINGNTAGDITLTSAPPVATAVSDKFYAVPASIRATDDGTHPRISNGGYGGQTLLVNATSAWLTSVGL